MLDEASPGAVPQNLPAIRLCNGKFLKENLRRQGGNKAEGGKRGPCSGKGQRTLLKDKAGTQEAQQGSPGPAAEGPLTQMWKGASQGERHLLPILGSNAERNRQIEGVCKLQRTPGQKELSSLLCSTNPDSPASLLIGPRLPGHASLLCSSTQLSS